MTERDKPHPFKWRERMLSFVYAGRGIKLLWREHNTRIHFAATLLVCVAGICFGLSAAEWVAIVIVIGFVWVTEALNTSIERLCDHVEPARHPAIAAIKDIAAGIGDAKEYKHRAEVAERALGEFAEHIRCINCPFFERCESSSDSMVYYSPDECFNVYLREAEKELAEERKDD